MLVIESSQAWLVDVSFDIDEKGGTEETAYDEAEEGEALCTEPEIVDGAEDVGACDYEAVEEAELEAHVEAEEADYWFGEEHVYGSAEIEADEEADCFQGWKGESAGGG